MSLQLQITLSDDQQLKVEGIPQNKILAFGLLKMAEVAMMEMFAQNEQRVQPAPPGLVLPKLS